MAAAMNGLEVVVDVGNGVGSMIAAALGNLGV